MAVDVGVVDLGLKLHLGGLEGVVGREMNGHKKDAAAVWRISWAHDSRLFFGLLEGGDCREVREGEWGCSGVNIGVNVSENQV